MIRIGISGWRYEPWRGVFYPDGLAQRRELEFAARHFPTLEINGSFYSLQRPEYYEDWYAQTPPGFIFAVKDSRYITHMLRLKEVDKPLANFFASGILALKDKLGPFLWQLPPMFPFKPERLEPFFEMLPRDTAHALSLARRRDSRMKGRARLSIDRNRPLRHAIEVRHPSFKSERFVELLRRHDIGLVVADTAGKWPYVEEVTASFMYLRLHGDKELYASDYTDAALERWGARIRAWRAGSQPRDALRVAKVPSPPRRQSRDVYCYFDNYAKVHAPFDAIRLANNLAPRNLR